MKKVLKLFLLVMLLPLGVNAVSIKSAEISAVNEISIGSEIPISFSINVDGLDRKDPNGDGIYAVAFEFETDVEVLKTSSWPNTWDTDVYYTDNSYIVESIVHDGMSSKIRCSDNYLICSDYEITINFFVKDTTKDHIDIKLKEVSIGTAQVNLDEYTEADLKETTIYPNKTHTIRIIKNDSTPTVQMPSTTQEPKKKTKSSNRYLKTLKIDGYDIDFDREKGLYTITIPQDQNTLDVKIETEDDKATYTVKGADDLKSNYNLVEIEVTAEDGRKKSYTVKAKVKENQDENGMTSDYKLFDFKIDKKYIKYGLIGLASIVGLTIIIIIISKIRDRKVNKAFKDMDKF